ncbi:MAG: PAS domain-containing protein [Pseudomonadota bacterium]
MSQDSTSHPHQTHFNKTPSIGWRTADAVDTNSNFFFTLAQWSPVGIFRTDDQDKCIYVSERWRELAGMPQADALGTGWVNAIYGDDRERVAQTWRASIEANLSFNMEYRMQGADGRITWVLGRARPEWDDAGKRIGYVGAITDISEYKADQAKLCERTEELTALLRVSQELITAQNLHALLQTVTDRIAELSALKSAAVFLLEEETLHLWATTPPQPPQYHDALRNAPLADFPYMYEAVTLGMPVFIPDTATADLTPAEQDIIALLNLRSVLFLPLIIEKKVTGVLIVATSEPQAFFEEQINRCGTFANMAALAVQNARLYESNQRYTAELEHKINIQALSEQVLRESEERWKFALEGSGDGVWDSDLQSGETHYSKRWKEMLGFAEHEIRNDREEWYQRIHPDDAPDLMANLQNHIEGVTDSTTAEFRMQCKDGAWKWIHGRGMVVSRDAAGKPLRIIGTNTDISERKQRDDELKKIRERYELATNVGKVGIWDWEPVSGNIVWNDEMYRVLGLTQGKVTPSSELFFEMIPLEDRKLIISAVREAIAAKSPYSMDFRVIHRNGQEHVCHASGIVEFDANDQAVRMLGTVQDITHRRQNEEQIWQLAHFDSLTGLPNRILLHDRATQAISMAYRTQQQFAVLFIDLDHFKNINDTLGHRIGDLLLIEVAARLKSIVRDVDTVARLGGDEFIVLLPGAEAKGTQQVAQNALHTIAQPYMLEQHKLFVTTSIGIAMYPKDGNDFDALTKCADIAMYLAKRDGRNNHRFFTPEILG